MLYPLVMELVGAGIPVTVACRVLKLSRQPYYRWLASPIAPSDVARAYRANALFDAHQDEPEFGHRLLVGEAPGRWRGDGGPDRVEDRVRERLVQRVREAEARQGTPAWTARARRPLPGHR